MHLRKIMIVLIKVHALADSPSYTLEQVVKESQREEVDCFDHR